MTVSTSALVRPFFSAFWTYSGYTLANEVVKMRCFLSGAGGMGVGAYLGRSWGRAPGWGGRAAGVANLARAGRGAVWARMRSHPILLVLVLVATALASAACGDAAPAPATSDASSRDAAAPAPDAAALDAAARDAAADDAAADAGADAAADVGTSSTADADAGASDVGTSSTADAGPSGPDAALGPSCALLATCCAELPASVFGPSCDTAAMGDEAACQVIVERARGIDRCLRPPAVDGGR
jgi:hypothetical protein